MVRFEHELRSVVPSERLSAAFSSHDARSSRRSDDRKSEESKIYAMRRIVSGSLDAVKSVRARMLTAVGLFAFVVGPVSRLVGATNAFRGAACDGS